MISIKAKVLFITNTPPIPTQGGAMTFYRHFVQSGDFEVAVITDDKSITKYDLPYSYQLINIGKFGARITSTRLYKWVQSYRRILGTKKIHPNILKFSSDFEPDVIFTVGGSWSWMAIIAQKTAKKLNIPLIGSFNDWWDYCAAYHPFFSKIIENKFRSFYKKCDLAICTSEGMKKELGLHKHSIVLYPTGAKMKEKNKFTPSNDTFSIAFAGNLGDWYGTMLEEIITNTTDPDIKYKVYGFNANWSKQFDEYVLNNDIFKGKVSFEQLNEEVTDCNALLLLMGFDDSCAMVERTSFKTKFLDYLTFQKPIILWGPKYCSAVYTANEFDSAEICTSTSVNEFTKTIENLKKSPKRQKQLVVNSQKMYIERFNPEIIHKNLLEGIQSIIK